MHGYQYFKNQEKSQIAGEPTMQNQRLTLFKDRLMVFAMGFNSDHSNAFIPFDEEDNQESSHDQSEDDLDSQSNRASITTSLYSLFASDDN